MRNILKDKKGDASETLMVLLIIVFLAISFIVVLFVNTKIQTIISDTEGLNSTTAAPSIISGLNEINLVTVQRGFIIFFAFLVIGVIISSFLIKIHPVFIFLYIITLAMTLFVAVFLSNIYDTMISNEQLATIATNQTMINWVMEHIVMIMLGVGALSMIVIFSKVFTAPSGDNFGREDI